ncbi:MAG: polynucleotide adenylyltransferase PcnB, partial [Acidobacteria bacterium]|nr:polynucleotide adenylyltransferase PcnB [Acidobacteriota bacterium]
MDEKPWTDPGDGTRAPGEAVEPAESFSTPLSEDAGTGAVRPDDGGTRPATTPAEPALLEVAWPMPADKLDPDAARVASRLAGAGHQAYLVGGCVRDLLFGARPKDFDVATSAHPNEIRRLFRNCRIIGRRFRLAHIHFREKIIEVATFRAPLPVSETATDEVELIRDDNVFGTAEEDARRRDFTFNALFYDVDRQVILDYVGGVADVERRVVRTIGDPNVRMREDPIRMLRAVRLAARLGCRIDDDSLRAIRAYRHEITRAAAPRIIEDLLRMFRGGAIAPAFELMLETGILEVVLPELHAHLSEPGATDEAEALRAVLRQADAWTRSGRELTTPVQLSLLLAPVVMTALLRQAGDARRYDNGELAVSLLRPIAQRLSVSKRDAERVRQILLTLGKLLPDQRRRRGGSTIARRAYFPETLDVFELMCLATGDHLEEAARWRRRALETEGAAAAPSSRP